MGQLTATLCSVVPDPARTIPVPAPCAGKVIDTPLNLTAQQRIVAVYESVELYSAQQSFIDSGFAKDKGQKLKELGFSDNRIALIKTKARPIRHHNVFVPVDRYVSEHLSIGRSFSRGDELYRYGTVPIAIAPIPRSLLPEIAMGAAAVIKTICPGGIDSVFNGRVINFRETPRDIVDVFIEIQSPLPELFHSLVSVAINAPGREGSLDVVCSEFWPKPTAHAPLPPLEALPADHLQRPAPRISTTPGSADLVRLRETLEKTPANHWDAEAERAICVGTVALAVKGQKATMSSVRQAAINRLEFQPIIAISLIQRTKAIQRAMLSRGALVCAGFSSTASVFGNNLDSRVTSAWQRDEVLPRPAAPVCTSMIDLSPQQEDALREIKRWYSAGGHDVFRLFGYAGTGKTTLAKELTEALSCKIAYAAYTGKAASILRSKGLEATTIHAGLYSYMTDDAGRVEFRYVDQSKALGQADVIVLDECSMVDAELARDIMALKKPIIALGDPMQLPPIGAKGYFTTGAPNFTLTEIHRQAQDNPIIRMAHELRAHKRLSSRTYGESCVLRLADLPINGLMMSDQAIAGRKDTCNRVTAAIRHLSGRNDDLPESGDKLVCLKNSKHRQLYNGEIWSVLSRETTQEDILKLTLTSEDATRRITVPVLSAPFTGFDIRGGANMSASAHVFGYGNVLTAHKSQGSEWPDVFVFDESQAFGSNAPNWLYTVITRASKRVTIVQS